MDERLGGRVALVTGGTSGLGLACADRFRVEGATVVTLDITDGADHVVDVRDEAAVQAAVDAVVAEHGQLDVVVNSAGVPGGGPVHLVPLEDFERVVVLTKNMAVDYGAAGIRVNAICPGFIDTPMFRGVMDSEGMSTHKETYRKQHKLQRFGRPDEIAGAAYFLASDDSSFVTGHALVVDGGFTAGMRAGIMEGMGL
jgi:NAD(P)-dependent dehydrogenase (short-subunit alcohol dehydrogenase family)